MQQNIIQGIDKLPQILKEINSKKVFLVVDSSYPLLNIKDAIETLEVEKVMSKINDHISVPAGTISMTEDILNKQKTIFNTTIKR